MPRRKPFSAKQKKQQLQQKRQRKKDRDESEEDSELQDGAEHQLRDRTGGGEPSTVQGDVADGGSSEIPRINKIIQQPLTVKMGVEGRGLYGRNPNPNRYRLQFESESKEEVERRKRVAKTVPITPLAETALEVSVDDIYAPGTVLDIPKRPPWSYAMSKEEVEAQEETMFKDYLEKIYSQHRPKRLSHFEHNLETWRQLWRVLEISDVVLLITDIRHPALHFSPALYDYVVKDLKKAIVLVLNKVDLVPPQVAVAWRHYFLTKFSQLNVICFTSYPDCDVSTEPSKKVRLKFKRGGRGRLPSAVGPTELFQVIETMYKGRVDLQGWRERLTSDKVDTPTSLTMDDNTIASDESESEGEEPVAMDTSLIDSSPLVRDDVRQGMLTIGLVGHPNVGKSSLINGLMGKKLVSTSRTPGHTKHFQTIFLTRSIRLCDCPGLVFPSVVDRSLQVLSGIYPIAQVREPYSVVGYLAERVPLVSLLRLEHPEGVATEYKRTAGKRLGDCDLRHDLDPKLAGLNLKEASHEAMWRKIEEEREWTPWNVCDAWAERRHYYTSRAARLDTYRAANSLLRLAADGRICLYFRPPGYSKEKAKWAEHPEVSDMMELQRRGVASSLRPSSSKDVTSTAAAAMRQSSHSVASSAESAISSGNKFELLNRCSDDNSS